MRQSAVVAVGSHPAPRSTSLVMKGSAVRVRASAFRSRKSLHNRNSCCLRRRGEHNTVNDVLSPCVTRSSVSLDHGYPGKLGDYCCSCLGSSATRKPLRGRIGGVSASSAKAVCEPYRMTPGSPNSGLLTHTAGEQCAARARTGSVDLRPGLASPFERPSSAEVEEAELAVFERPAGAHDESACGRSALSAVLAERDSARFD